MTPDQYTFAGDSITFLGLVGVISAFIIVITAFRRFFNSPYNVRYVNQNDIPTDNSGSDGADCT